MKWEVFRDKLRPGQKEEWKLTIKTPQGQAAEAEMLATMYDASLDKIWNRKQNFSVFYNQIIPYSSWMGGYFGNNSFNYWWNNKYFKVPTMEYDYFVTQGTMSMDQALNGMVPGVMVRGYGVQKQASMTGSMMIRGVSRSKAEAKYVPALVGSVAEDAVFESELVSVEICVRTLRKQPSSTHNFVPMNKAKFPSPSLCPKV